MEYQLSYTASEIDTKLGEIDNAVKYTEQTLTNEQKLQVRENIDAASPSDIPTKTSDLTNDSGFTTETQVNALLDEKLATITNAEKVAF